MFRLLLFRLSRRRGIATIIGGLIILTLILTALGTMVFVSQQYSQFQQTVNKMTQYKDQEQSENLVANSPGLILLTSTTVPGWGTGCTTTYNCYNATISNLGGVGVQIVRIYITSTGTAGAGCSSPNPAPCILNPTSTIGPYAFNQAEQFLNPGEVNHVVILALPSSVSLPYASPPPNTIAFATSRGNVFSFQWPFQIQIGGQSQSAFSAGIVKVAYQGTSSGYDSENEPGHGGAGGSGYCHKEPSEPYPAGTNYAEELTGINYAKVGDSGVLWFVNPWVTQTILLSACNQTCSGENYTTLYIYVNITNTGNTNYKVAGGTIDLTWYGSNHIDGALIGIYYGAAPGTFYPIGSTQTVAPGKSFYAIFRVTTLQLNTSGSGSEKWPPTTAVMFWGSASLTDSTEDSTFVGGVSLSSGLWIPVSC